MVHMGWIQKMLINYEFFSGTIILNIIITNIE